MAQHQEKARIIRFEQLSPKTVRLTLAAPQIAAEARPGHFVMIRAGLGKDPLLRRPFSIHQASSNGQIQIYFRVVGRGTDLLARTKVGEALDVFGPLGRGYRIEAERPAYLIGGGLGIAPLLFLAKRICQSGRDLNRDQIMLGGRSSDDVAPLVPDFQQFGLPLQVVTDDGSYGRPGLVTDLLDGERIDPSGVVYACGPEPMLAQVARFCADRGAACQVSIESVMACGMGACLGCNVDASGGGYLHVCIDGPVFNAEDLAWNM